MFLAMVPYPLDLRFTENNEKRRMMRAHTCSGHPTTKSGSIEFELSTDSNRDHGERGRVENRQKSSKRVKTNLDIFR